MEIKTNRQVIAYKQVLTKKSNPDKKIETSNKTSNDRTANKSLVSQASLAGILGYCTMKGTQSLLSNYINKSLLHPIIKSKLNIDKSEIDKIRNLENIALQTNNLSKKGVKILYLDKNSFKDYIDSLNPIRNNTSNNKYIKSIKIFFNKFMTNKFISFKKGENACFYPKKNTILLSKNHPNLELSVFHEMGHAKNHHFGVISKFLQRQRSLVLLVPFISLYALFSKKANNEKEKTNKESVKTWIQNHAGILATACYIPTILEEAIASIKGAKIAKDLLPKNLYKNTVIGYIFALSTYVCCALFTGISIQAGLKVRDSILGSKQETTNT